MKKSILVLVVVSYVLSGCHNMKSSRSSMNSTDDSSLSNNELDSDISNIELPIIETEYGRGASSDGKDTNANEEATRLLSDEEKSIIIFFSRSGNTQNLARMIRNEVGSDMLELQVTDPYPADYEKAVARATQEREDGEYPGIKTNIPSLSQYERIYLGYQTWGMTLSNPITSFLMENEKKLSGKVIYPFSTNAGYGEGDSMSRIKEIVPNATIAESFNIHDEELLANRGRVEGWIKTTL